MLRKAILIAQHIKGPVDKPLRLRNAVKVWDHKEVRGRHRAERGGGAAPLGGPAPPFGDQLSLLRPRLR
jgi:hypothetical protein